VLTCCSAAHGLAQKLYNWSTLNQRVFKRLGFVVAKAECEACAGARPGAIERVLKLVKYKLSRFAEGPKSSTQVIGSLWHHSQFTQHFFFCPLGDSALTSDAILSFNIRTINAGLHPHT
jgi:hypothetical protein